jgi:ABC-type multidrug transport system fused ATPase/permease subunit
MSAPIVQPILVFLTYILIQDDPLTPAKAFTTVALFNIMRFPFAFLPMGLLQYIQSAISLRRLTAYLLLPELEQITLPEPPPDALIGSPETIVGSVTMKNNSFCWVDPNASHDPITGEKKAKMKHPTINEKRISPKLEIDGKDSVTTDLEATTASDPAILKDISIKIEAGSLVAVVGEVGCGKSSFLSAIFGEMEPLNGSKVYMPRDVDHDGDGNFLAFCNQTPWVINDTVRGNIVFGRAFDGARYQRVIKACALIDDLAILPAGDMTEIGERGINVSGGQKARISLARAIYSPKTKVLLLDDPLSAVDSHVGEHLFEEAINGEMLKGTTRVLVTHHVHFLPRCDLVVVLEGGRIKHYGTYADLVAQGVDFAGAVDITNQSEATDDTAADGKTGIEISTESADVAGKAISDQQNETEKMKEKGEKLITEEEHMKGSVESVAYFHYAKAGGIFVAILTLFAQSCSRAFELGAYFWLSYWSNETVKASLSNIPFTESKTLEYLGIYSIFGVASIVFLAFRAALLAFHRCRACRKLHFDLMESILRSPISFFDVTPTGRILNRFAYDTEKVDFELR